MTEQYPEPTGAAMQELAASAVCPVCGRDDIEATSGETGTGHNTCRACGAQWDTEPEDAPEALKLSAESIVAQVRERCDRAFDNSKEEREVWAANYKAYSNQYDLGKRLPWQSKVTVPLISRSVLHKVGRIVAAMVSGTEDYYVIHNETPEGEVAIPVHGALLKANLEREKFPSKVESALVGGELTCGPAFLITPLAQGAWSTYFSIDSVDMRRVARDHTTRDRFKVALDAMDYSDLQRKAREAKWDMEAVGRLKGGTADIYRPEIKAHIEKASRITSIDTQDQRRRTVALTEYWGPLHDDEGEEVYRFAYVVLGDGRELVYFHDDPHGDGKCPLIDSDILPNVFGAYGKSDVEDARELAELNTRLLRAMIDGAAYDVMRCFVVDVNRIDPTSLDDLTTGGLSPGLIIQQEGDPRNQPAIAPLDVGSMPMHLLALYQVARQEFEGGIEVTDMSRGTPTAGGAQAQTATEYAGKSQAASQGLDTLTQACEEKSMEPTLERCVYYQGRYFDPEDDRTLQLAREAIESALNLIFERDILPTLPPEPEEPTPEDMAAMFQRDVAPGLPPEPRIPDGGDSNMAMLYDDAMQEHQMNTAHAADQYKGQMMQMFQSAMQEHQQIVGKAYEAARPQMMQTLAAAMQEPFTVSVRGIRGVLAQGEQFAKMTAAADFATRLGAGIMLDVPDQVTRAYHLSGIDPKDALKPDAEEVYNEQQARNQQMQMAQGPGWAHNRDEGVNA